MHELPEAPTGQTLTAIPASLQPADELRVAEQRRTLLQTAVAAVDRAGDLVEAGTNEPDARLAALELEV